MMTLPRFFCSMPLASGAHITLPQNVAHHAVRVLRLTDGAAISLFNGDGVEYAARLMLSGGPPRACVEAWEEPHRESSLPITLVQALPSADKMDWIIQKAVELGAVRVVPVVAARSVVRLSGERAKRRSEHWQQVAVAACEQCGRNHIPEVSELLELRAYLGLPAKEGDTRIILAPEASIRLKELGRPASTTVLIGPEGGFTPEEQDLAETVGFLPMALGPRILRTETAGPAVLAALGALFGDL